MNELRNTVSTTPIPRTGTLVVTQVVDLEKLREDGDSVLLSVVMTAGVYEVALERRGKTKILRVAPSEEEAESFVLGFKACADVRRVQNRKPPKRQRKTAEKPGGESK
jgi:hypothetical protein